MIDNDFNNSIKDFLSGTFPPDEEVILTKFKIEMQPGLVSFGGQMTLTENRVTPINLKKIGKRKCNELTGQIESYHTQSTNNGQNKWNIALVTIGKSGNVDSEFIWDEEFEQENISSFQADNEQVRRKWYWEEK